MTNRDDEIVRISDRVEHLRKIIRRQEIEIISKDGRISELESALDELVFYSFDHFAPHMTAIPRLEFDRILRTARKADQ